MDKQLLKKSIECQALVIGGQVYRPQVDVVDYGGTLCYTARIPLENGETCKATSFEVKHSAAESASLEEVLSLLQDRCKLAAASGVSPRSSCLDQRLTIQYQDCLK